MYVRTAWDGIMPTDICFSFTGLVRVAAVLGRIKTAGELPFTRKGCARLDRNRATIRRLPKLVQNYPINYSSVMRPLIRRKLISSEIGAGKYTPFYPGIMGRNWTYAHNGQLNVYKSLKR